MYSYITGWLNELVRTIPFLNLRFRKKTVCRFRYIFLTFFNINYGRSRYSLWQVLPRDQILFKVCVWRFRALDGRANGKYLILGGAMKCAILSLSTSSTAYPDGRRIFDRTAETTFCFRCYQSQIVGTGCFFPRRCLYKIGSPSQCPR